MKYFHLEILVVLLLVIFFLISNYLSCRLYCQVYVGDTVIKILLVTLNEDQCLIGTTQIIVADDLKFVIKHFAIILHKLRKMIKTIHAFFHSTNAGAQWPH